MHARTGLLTGRSPVSHRAYPPRASPAPAVAAYGEARRPAPRDPRYADRPRGPAQPAPSAPLPPRAPPSSDDVYLPRSLLMDKEVITRTSGRRLGYVNQLYVDPARLEVVSVYLRGGVTSLGASNTDHVLVSSLRQIGDVVLVHDESALLDPPADETYGYVRLVGTEVQTEDGVMLGKVRDFVFNPDNGQVVAVKYDALGLPSIPQSLLSCYTLGWQDIVAVGPTKTIVRRGAERRAVKENEGWITEYVTALVAAVAGAGDEERLALGDSEAYRSDPAYATWYAQHAAEYERYYGQRLPPPVTAAAPPPSQRGARQGPPPPQGRRRAPGQPMALPPPRSTSYRQALQADQQQQQQQQQPWRGQAPPQREYDMVGASPPRQRQYAGTQGSEGPRRSRQPPPFAGRPEGAGQAPPPPRTRPPAERPPRPAAAPAGAQPVEPDAVISGGTRPPRMAARQPADFTPAAPQQPTEPSS